MISPMRHVSPFDVNMAADAGFDHILTYPHVEVAEVRALVQDAMFSRPPKLARRTAFFIGGKNAVLALAMMQAAQEAMFPPFELSLFADPAGSFTTAGAMVACVEKALKERKDRELKGCRVAVFGATGVVGFGASVIAAGEGAKVTLVGYDGPDRVKRSAEEIRKRFNLEVDFADGSTEARNTDILNETEVAFSAARAGLQVLSKQQIDTAPDLLVVADVNAVPPSGVEGLDMKANGIEIGKKGALGIGPLAIGDVKYKTELGLFKAMIEAEKAVAFDFRHAFKRAREIVGLDG
jgi:methylene-tetrahydromethanopterin dehydrogenase